MKNVFITCLLIVWTAPAFSNVVSKRAVVRDENFSATTKEVVLPDLTSDNSYEGKFFKIVEGKNDEAVRFDDSEDLQLKAATTYYHLNRARRYFTDVIKSPYVQSLPQITIRLDLLNVFNEIGHFANDNLDPQYNNALSVPAGRGYAPKNISPWGNEIWFRPAKEINIKDFKGVVDYGPSLKTSLQGFRRQTHMTNFEQFIISLYGATVYGNTPVSSMMRLVGSSLLLEAIYQSSDFTAEFFSRKIYRLDSALVPEIIYHEFSHIALSDHLELSHSTPVNEGLADYFAGKIANSKKLATNIKDYNLFSGKKVEKKQQYHLAFERGEFANADFVFGLLWNVGETVGTDIEGSFMYDMTKTINTNVSIKDDLINATIETCKSECKSPFNDRLRLYKLFNSKNL
jgi:hypothetical protein